jgi:hypothetical protein
MNLTRTHEERHPAVTTETISTPLPADPAAVNIRDLAKPGAHLLDAIEAMHWSIGDGLNEYELTRLLQKLPLPTEAGFSFLTFSDRFVTFTVPLQDPASWYPESAWIAPEKERIVQAIAKKYELSLFEPPDSVRVGSQNPHHHLELVNLRETMIVIHPQYLKIRLFSSAGRSSFRGVQRPVHFGPSLLRELSALY